MTALLDLPFRELWVVDSEYYPGRGLANGGREGDPLTPLCLVAVELRTGQVVQLWQDQLGPFPPYRLDGEALFICYMATAELGFHIACGWGQPANVLDVYLEFRHHVNDGAVTASERPKGFYSLDGALQYFGADGIDTAHKKNMRGRILQGPPFTRAEKADFLHYCEEDTRALARLAARVVPTIRSLPHALYRAKYQWPMAQAERRGVPIDPLFNRLRSNWDEMRAAIVREKDMFGLYEIDESGKPHWRAHRWAEHVRERGMAWPTLGSGALNLTDEAFKEMEFRYPHVRGVRQLRATLSKLKLNRLQVGNDNRNRTLLGAYGAKTGRNTPSSAEFIFGPAKWLRYLIAAPLGWALIHRDYKQQEPIIGALLSGDVALLEACESGDVYLGVAKMLGMAPPDATPQTHPEVRSMFKIVVLAISYGQGARSLALHTGLSYSEACEVLARLRARFCRFEEYTRSVLDHAGLKLEIATPFGWTMQCPPGINPRTVRNFPIQATGSEILHVACILAERRGIPIVAPVHDAIMCEASADRAEEMSAALDRCMRDASAVVLRGYELRSDEQIIRPGERFIEPAGTEMWETVCTLLAELEAKRA